MLAKYNMRRCENVCGGGFFTTTVLCRVEKNSADRDLFYARSMYTFAARIYSACTKLSISGS